MHVTLYFRNLTSKHLAGERTCTWPVLEARKRKGKGHSLKKNNFFTWHVGKRSLWSS